MAVLTVGAGAAEAATPPSATALNPITCTNEVGLSTFHPTIKTATPLKLKEKTNAVLTGCSNTLGSTIVFASLTGTSAYVAPPGFGGCTALNAGTTYLVVFNGTITWTVLNNPSYSPPTVTYTSKVTIANVVTLTPTATTSTVTGNFAAAGTDGALFGAPFTFSNTFVTPNCAGGFTNIPFTGPAGITVT